MVSQCNHTCRHNVMDDEKTDTDFVHYMVVTLTNKTIEMAAQGPRQTDVVVGMDAIVYSLSKICC